MAGESGRSGLTGPAMILALLAALGIGPSLVSQSPQNSTKKGTTTARTQIAESHLSPAAENVQAPSHSAAELLERFLDTNYSQIYLDEPWSADTPSVWVAGPCSDKADAAKPECGADGPADRLKRYADWRQKRWPDGDPRARYHVRFLIAIVPEPDSPPLRSSFDSDIEAIQTAFSRAGFGLSSFDIPWIGEAQEAPNEFNLGGELDLSVGAKGTPVEMIKQTEPDPRSRRDPGLMLFHSGVGEETLSLVLVVGDGPVSGINRVSLRNALDQIAGLSGWKKGTIPPPCHLYQLIDNRNRDRQSELCGPTPDGVGENTPFQVKIIGPIFTNSATSLRNTLTEWTREGASFRPNGLVPRISVVSGDATSITTELQLTSPATDYQSVRISDQAILNQIECEFTGSRTPVVFLSERTAYGDSYKNSGPTTSKECDQFPLQRISFPLHISDLRTAFGKLNPNSSDPLPSLHTQDINIPDEEGRINEDVLPAFSTRSAVYDQLVLDRLLATINHEHVHYVGITASDIEDLLFLVHEIRDHCQDVEIFTTSADLMLTHSANYTDTAGMLVFSTYPLFDEFQTNSSAALLQFPNEGAEGVYNATLVQIGGQEQHLLDYRDPFDGSDQKTPLLWLSVVGRGGIWPVKFIPPTIDANYRLYTLLVSVAPAGFDRAHLDYPDVFQIFYAFTALFCLAPCALLMWPSGLGLRPSSKLYQVLIDDSVFADLRLDRRYQRTALFLVLLSIQLVSLAFYLIPFTAPVSQPATPLATHGLHGILVKFVTAGETVISIVRSQPAASLVVLGLAGTLIGLAAAAKALISTVGSAGTTLLVLPLGRRNTFAAAPTSGRENLVATAVILLFAIGMTASLWWQPSGYRFLNFIRAANMGNGVSVLTPLMFIAIAGVAVIAGQLWRIRMLDERRVSLPFLNFEQRAKSFLGVGELEREVIERLECSAWWLPGLILSMTPLAAFMAFLIARFGVNPLEPPMFGWAGWPSWFESFFFVSALFSYLFLSTRLLRLALVWAALRRLMRRLWWHPSHDGYRKLGEEKLGSVSFFSGANESVEAIEIGLEAARKIGESIAGIPVALRSKAMGFFYKVMKLEEAFAASFVADDRLVNRLRTRLVVEQNMSVLASAVTELSESIWRSGPEFWAAKQRTQVRDQASLFIAARVFDLLRKIFPHLINLAAFSMVGVVAMMLAISSYPFPERDTLIFLTWAALLGVVALTMTVFVEINRDPLISALTGAKAGFSWDSAFTVHILTYAVLPILALLGAQFPRVFAGIFSWFSGHLGGA